MQLNRVELDNPKTWTRTRIIDQFIGDVLLPTTQSRTVNVATLYDLFTDYCSHLGFGIPCQKPQFGRHLATRFQKRTINGYREYFCEIRPEMLLEGDAGGRAIGS